MIIHCYTFAWNEEVILPHFLRYYSQFCDKIVVYDNESTDNTSKIIRNCPVAEHRTYCTNNTHAEHAAMVPLRNSAWQESRSVADFVVIVDCDEFIHHHDLSGFFARLKAENISVVRAHGWEMISEDIPVVPDGKYLPDVLRTGVHSSIYSKPCILAPDLIDTASFAHGAHSVQCTGRVKAVASASLKLLHYKRLGWEYFWARTMALKARSDVADLAQGNFVHYRWPYETVRKMFVDMLNSAVEVTL